MKQNTPLISIILPVFNGESYLAEAINSIVNQSYQNIELIVINDCSTDNSLDIAQNYAQKDDRILVHNNAENLKLPASINKGHQIAKGDFITWTSDDNILHINFCEVMLAEIQGRKCDLIYSDYEVIDAVGLVKGHIKRKDPVETLLINTVGASFMYTKAFKNKNGAYNSDLFLCEDYHYWLKGALNGIFYHLNKNLYQYRKHNQSLTHQISTNGQIKSKFKNAIKKAYSDIGASLNWSEHTLNFLTEYKITAPETLEIYLNHHKIIQNDLLKYINIQHCKKTDWNFVLNNHLYYVISRTTQPRNFSCLIKIIKTHPSMLFKNRYSFIHNFKTIIKFIFRK